ncbi:MAG: hypothetical protein ACU0CJ_13160 [Sulfitobacter sp.]|jgi:outer membrane murein-binding lipoprotein Lpp|uniref:hypothetical protein n=2 Tax=Sulfitobacter TaxID=60136 RepID=UPI0008327DA4|nr:MULTISPECIES: hypothetical protein [unclassified Sulfitobacter]WPZ30478.1 hypothetical protein T8A63_05300 [Sulfitobacter sp. OXR-159]
MTLMRTPRPFSIAALLLGVTLFAGCAQFPELDRTITPELEAAPYPDIVPIAPLLAQATAGRIDPVQTEAELSGRAAQLEARAGRVSSNSTDTTTAARVARLRARAERLRQQRITSDERERLAQTPAL